MYCSSGYYKISYFLTPKSSDRLQLVMFLSTTASLFQLCITKNFLHRCLWPRVLGSEEVNPL
jgi:hypothetical protein